MRLGILCVLIAIASIVYPCVCFAQESANNGYFDFDLSQNLLRDGQEVKVKFRWAITDFDMRDQKRLTVKPFLSSGAVAIYNEDLGRYIGMADFSSTFPYLREEMTLKFSGIQSLQSPAVLTFVVSDTLTDKNYPTPANKIWGTAYYTRYTDLLNENILSASREEKVEQTENTNIAKTDINKPQDPVKLYLWYLSPAFFLYGLLKSPSGFG